MTFSFLYTNYRYFNVDLNKEKHVPAMEPLCHIWGVDSKKLNKEEMQILEAELFTRIYEEVLSVLKNQYKDYFRLMKFNTDMENTMVESNFIRCLINDILAAEAYTIPGIALYTQTPEDIIYDLASGCNANPTLMISRKIIDLHRSVRPQLYQNILKKTLETICISC